MWTSITTWPHPLSLSDTPNPQSVVNGDKQMACPLKHCTPPSPPPTTRPPRLLFIKLNHVHHEGPHCYPSKLAPALKCCPSLSVYPRCLTLSLVSIFWDRVPLEGPINGAPLNTPYLSNSVPCVPHLVHTLGQGPTTRVH